MSLYLRSFVDDWRTVYNPIEYVLEETDGTKLAYKGFRYLVDVYDGATLLGRLKIPLDPNNYGRADVHGVCESYLTSNIGTIGSTTAFTDNAESWKTFKFKFGEEYFNGTAWVTDAGMNYIAHGVEDNTEEEVIIFNGSLPNYRGTTVNFYDWQPANYYQTYTVNAVGIKCLSNAPLGGFNAQYFANEDTTKVELTDEGWLYFLYDDASNVADRIKVTRYTGGAIPITSDVDIMMVGTVTGKHLRIPSAPASLNTVQASTVTASYNAYSISLYNGVTQVSESRRFNIASDCRYETRRIEFLNSLGGFDFFNFTKISRRNEKIERKFFKMNQDNLDTTDGSIDYSIRDREKVQYYTISRPSMKLTSDWVSVDIYNYLLEMMSSPEVYLHEVNNVTGAMQRIPVKSLEGNWEQKLSTADSVFNLEVTIDFGMDNIRQRW